MEDIGVIGVIFSIKCSPILVAPSTGANDVQDIFKEYFFASTSEIEFSVAKIFD